MRLRYNYRLYPTPTQRTAMERLFGCVRVVWNDGLSARREAHNAGLPYITNAELPARLTASKGTPERAWLREVSAVPLQQSLADLNAPYRNFFDSRSGSAAGSSGGWTRASGLIAAWSPADSPESSPKADCPPGRGASGTG